MRHAILIASATFEPDSGIEPLRFPANDVAALEELFRTEDFKFDEITRIIDQPKHFIEKKLDGVLSESSFDDFLLIYFSGHGKLNAKGELFLSCRNTKEKTLNGTGFKYSHLMEMLNAHSAERVAIILDCCYAGRAISGFKGSTSEQIRSQLDSGRGIFILGASGATQTAEEREADGNGIFTKHIIQGLQTGSADIDGDGQISLTDLAKYIRDEFRRNNISQDPVVGNFAKSGDLILGSNRKLKHKRLLASIKLKFDQTKALFEKATRRAIEDYLDDILETPGAWEDNRFIALKKFATGGSIEPVIEAFRRETGKPEAGARPKVNARVKANGVPEIDAGLPFDLRRSRFILIGTSTYPDDPNLPYLPAVENNLIRLKQILLDPEIVGAPEDSITVIANPPNKMDLSERLITGLKGARDFVLIYYAGHAIFNAQTNRIFLGTMATTQQHVNSDGFDFDELELLFESLRCEQTIFSARL